MCSRPSRQRERQQSNGRSCTADSCYRILICADAATRAESSASQTALKGTRYTMTHQLNSLRNRNYREIEPGGALLGFQFAPLLCRRNQTSIHPTDAWLTALGTSYKIHEIPHRLNRCLKVLGLFTTI